MPKSKKSTRKSGSRSHAQDTARRLANPSRFAPQDAMTTRGSVAPKGGRPPRFPGRTGGR